MPKMTMIAVDQLHVSVVGPDSVPAGAQFEVEELLGGQLEKAGLAVRATERKPRSSRKA